MPYEYSPVRRSADAGISAPDGIDGSSSARRLACCRDELGALLVTAGLSSARDHALAALLALNGLRVSEAIGANIEVLGQERGHRTVTVLRKGGKVVTMPLAPRVARAIDLAVSERLEETDLH